MAKRKPARSTNRALVTAEHIDGAILVIRRQKVHLDEYLAAFYGVEVKRLVEAMKRNIERFPTDIMFRLDREEWVALKSQFATLNNESNLSGAISDAAAGFDFD